MPALPLDQQDRRLLGIAGVYVLAFVLAVLILAAALGTGVRVFLLTSGIGG